MLLPPPIHGQISSILLLLIRKRPTAETTFFGHMTFGHKIAAHRPIPRGGRGVGLSICDPSLSPHPCVTRHHRHIVGHLRIPAPVGHVFLFLAPKLLAGGWHLANRYIRPHPSPSIPMCANANQKRHPNSNMTALKFE
ncbi:hypothetical protein niasHS_005330 [Heterodera schachtii]|uniref:Uncharacterized protein n=1 Tax=Heterodera schachtii TaxID=97005 RepID=A0ABD2J8Z6_HETSC